MMLELAIKKKLNWRWLFEKSSRLYIAVGILLVLQFIFAIFIFKIDLLFPEKYSGLDGTGAGEDAMESPQGPAEDAAPQKEAGGWQEYLPLIHTGLDLLRAFRRKLVLRRLECRVVLAGPDPCDLAVNYGRLCAAVAGLMPQIERLFTIRKKDIQIQCDYNATQTRVFFQADLVISVGKLLLLALVYGIRGLREYWTILNNRKGGAVT